MEVGCRLDAGQIINYIN